MSYRPIEDYGVVGDMHTVAMVALDGSLDFLCLPDFDSPMVFGALLDDSRGGSFRIGPAAEGARLKQLYLPDTNILLTRFLSDDGVGEVVDFMPGGFDPPHPRGRPPGEGRAAPSASTCAARPGSTTPGCRTGSRSARARCSSCRRAGMRCRCACRVRWT